MKKKELKFLNKKPNNESLEDMIFAFTVAKFVNSNAIICEKISYLGYWCSQTNRIDSAKQAIKRLKENFGKIDSVLASDGFFPFPDIVKICAKNHV